MSCIPLSDSVLTDVNFSWDDWVPVGRIRKDTTENRELALSLRNLYSAGSKSGPSKADHESTNGEKSSRKRQRDNETETVSAPSLSPSHGPHRTFLRRKNSCAAPRCVFRSPTT